jgi:hypothetical protein
VAALYPQRTQFSYSRDWINDVKVDKKHYHCGLTGYFTPCKGTIGFAWLCGGEVKDMTDKPAYLLLKDAVIKALNLPTNDGHAAVTGTPKTPSDVFRHVELLLTQLNAGAERQNNNEALS